MWLHQVDVEVDGAAEDGGEVGHLGQVSHQLRKLRVQLGLKHCVFCLLYQQQQKINYEISRFSHPKNIFAFADTVSSNQYKSHYKKCCRLLTLPISACLSSQMFGIHFTLICKLWIWFFFKGPNFPVTKHEYKHNYEANVGQQHLSLVHQSLVISVKIYWNGILSSLELDVVLECPSGSPDKLES